ncbi:DUF6164 family protein [Nitrosomonas sp.]|uniref:DUF6164 family protein n=1 Tax=Nitrosomonas sp. TaxID=42353 RepID=UPI001E1062F3|nr:DUF6164 family protein [Nitrosomonas sp.]MCB1948365.1 hypothetical protein [Nitrosomonas sp.]MCP5242558.1 hypothetical protein [Burkholderiales bacterium]MDR4514084.1 DUF6164 family protein [Nitrosomonas sp.]
MSKILFKLNGVPDDEAEDVRALLAGNDIEFFETSAGNWGVSMPAIWLKDATQFSKARALLDEYQKSRTIRMREEYCRLKKAGKHKTFIDAIKEKPVLFIVYLVVTILVIYLSIRLVIDIGEIGLKE